MKKTPIQKKFARRKKRKKKMPSGMIPQFTSRVDGLEGECHAGLSPVALFCSAMLYANWAMEKIVMSLCCNHRNEFKLFISRWVQKKRLYSSFSEIPNRVSRSSFIQFVNKFSNCRRDGNLIQICKNRLRFVVEKDRLRKLISLHAHPIPMG